MTANPVSLSLQRLAQGDIPALTRWAGGDLAEAASVTFEAQGHVNSAPVAVKGVISCETNLSTLPVDDQMRRTHGDPQEALERGACGVAILLIVSLTPLTAIERARKGPGVDYWLGDGNGQLPFQRKARLEVSGIARGDDATIAQRVSRKVRQTAASDGTKLPAYVAIVEFSRPLAHVTTRTP